MSTDPAKHIVVLGAGVVGLTTALRIQERGGYNVSVVAEALPSDPKSIKYTTHWAGAQHVTHSYLGSYREKIDKDTFKTFWELSEPGGPAEHCFLRITHSEFFHKKPEDIERLMGWYPDFREIPEDELRGNATYGVRLSTVTIDTPRYTNYLLSRFLAAGGSVTRGRVQHINEVVEGGSGIYTDSKKPTPVHAVVVCNGLGARSLGGIEDKDVYPIRGQTILVRAPWVKFGMGIATPNMDAATYIIPRRSGDVVVGGTFDPNDWYPAARSETAEDILQRGFALCPELAPTEVRKERTPVIDDVRPLIIENGCGLRPERTGSIRLSAYFVYLERKGRVVPIVTNYGHGGSGVQTSWGSSDVAVDLLERALWKIESTDRTALDAINWPQT